MEQVIHTDAEHKGIQSGLDQPVNFLLPLVKIPMLRLESGQTPVGKIADRPVFKAGLFDDVQILNVNGIPVGDHIAVPEIVAACLPFKEIINGIQGGAATAAGQV